MNTQEISNICGNTKKNQCLSLFWGALAVITTGLGINMVVVHQALPPACFTLSGAIGFFLLSYEYHCDSKKHV